MVRDGILCLSARSHSVKNAADTKLENTSLSAGVFQESRCLRKHGKPLYNVDSTKDKVIYTIYELFDDSKDKRHLI